MKRKVVFFIFCMVIWIGLNWPVSSLWLATGLIVSIVVSFIGSDFFLKRIHMVTHIKRYYWLGQYVLVFLFELLKANMDILCRMMRPNITVSSGIVKVNTEIKTESGLTLLANAITFSKGAAVLDIDAKNGCLYIHWFDVENQNISAQTEAIVVRFEKILKRIFE